MPSIKPLVTITAAILLLTSVDFAAAHHVLGRPASSLSENSNTPPGLHFETQIGEYFVTYMAFPAFPKPGKPGRVNLYVTSVGDGTPFKGAVTFTARSESWLSWLGIGGEEVVLGVQPVDDNVYRQRYLFEEAGEYIVTAEFEAGGEPHIIDFPLRIGEPAPVGPIGIGVGLLIVVLLSVNMIQRRRAMTGKIRAARDAKTRDGS